MNRRNFLYFSCHSAAVASGALWGSEVAIAEPGRTEAEDAESAADSWPKIKAKLLFVQRDWSQQDDEQLSEAIVDSLEGKTLPNERTPAKDESELLSVVSFVPGAGQAAVYQPRDFSHLKQWLLEAELLVAEKAIRLKPTRFDGRWTATIEPDTDTRILTQQTWNLQIDLTRSSDQAKTARVSVKRSHSRRSPPGGPVLRGAAVDLRKGFSFLLPRDHAVVMSWYAHPEDNGRAPSPDQRTVEPILVLEEVRESAKAFEPSAKFMFPKRLIELMVD